MSELVEWLLAVLEEHERVARAASPGPWRPNAEQDQVVAVDDITVCEGFALSNNQVRNTVQHIAMHDPTAVLADIASKRALCRLLQEHDRLSGVHPACDDLHGEALERAVRVIATAYAHSPGYRDTWA